MRNVVSTALAVLISLLTLVPHAEAYEVDDSLPEVTDRVARISFIRGDVQVRRDGTDDWEKADLNLPIVEGDEIATDANGRLEIQFNGNTHLRLAENTSVQIRQLADGGIAVSVSRGVANVRLRKFEADKEFFEIDAPSTTVALQREGSYKIVAEGKDDGEVRVAVTNGGEARIYSANSGFTLKSGRSAKVFVAGNLAGEWETADASRFSDEFDSWTAERDDVIARSLKNSHYGKYYDQDIYGADELNDHGDWQYTNDYGFVWQPNQSAIRSYRDWSPYRYGSWRWVPPFGWTWVNDEPWGWATYHHGRWVWYRGRWAWTPYGHYRSNRSWWYPALVVVRVIDRSICWYPLPYKRGYYNYNHSYHDYVGNRDRGRRYRDRDRRPADRGTGTGGVPTPTPLTNPLPPNRDTPLGRLGRKQRRPKSLETDLPPDGVISVPADSFGVGKTPGSRATPEIAKTVLNTVDGASMPPALPTYQAVRRKMGRQIDAPPPFVTRQADQTLRLGAADRQPDTPLDKDLRRSRIFGNRAPRTEPAIPTVTIPSEGTPAPRRTGAFERPSVPKRIIDRTPVERSGGLPPKSDPVVTVDPDNQPAPRRELPRFDPTPRRESPKRQPGPPRVEPARRDPDPPQQQAPRNDPPRREPPHPRQEQPRSDPPRREPSAPRQEQPRSDPPRRDPPAPKSDSPKSNPPAPRSDPGAGSRKKEPGN